MKVKKLLKGYVLRLNDSEFAALRHLLDETLTPENIKHLRRHSPNAEITRGLGRLHLTVDDDRRAADA